MTEAAIFLSILRRFRFSSVFTMSVKNTLLIFNGCKNRQLVPFVAICCVEKAQISKNFQEEEEEQEQEVINRNK